ncbi:MAG: S1C family serine protease [Acidimicrobiia bacterium]
MSYDEPPTAAVPPAPGPHPLRSPLPSPRRWLALLVAAFVVVGGSAALGRAAETTWGGGTASSSGSANTSPFRPADSSFGGSDASSDSSGSSSSGASRSIDVVGIADAASPAILNIQTTLEDGNQAAGSGMVITRDGVVLTNNHVIEGAEKIRAEIGVTGKTYTADVVGYDVADDVAVLQLRDASNMKTVSIGDPSDVRVNDAIVAIGNAQGRFGAPTVVSGYVSDTAETITAGDGGTDTETLRDMIEIQADIQSGDSGGPLLNGAGEVIGINSAAEISGGRFGFGPGSGASSGGVGYAIPIDRALQIVEQIENGDESNGVYVGSRRALLGVGLEADVAQGYGSFGYENRPGPDSSGAVVAEVQSGGAADDVGITAGDTVVAVDGDDVGSADDLRTAMESLHPGDEVRIDWVDGSGSSRHATIELGAGPPA